MFQPVYVLVKLYVYTLGACHALNMNGKLLNIQITWQILSLISIFWSFAKIYFHLLLSFFFFLEFIINLRIPFQMLWRIWKLEMILEKRWLLCTELKKFEILDASILISSITIFYIKLCSRNMMMAIYQLMLVRMSCFVYSLISIFMELFVMTFSSSLDLYLHFSPYSENKQIDHQTF